MLLLQEKTLRACFFLLFVPISQVFSQTRVLEARMHHLRAGNFQEWLDFSEPYETELTINFETTRNAVEKTIRLRQEDVRQHWSVMLNGKPLGKLRPDENPMVVYWAVPASYLITGQNRLTIRAADTTLDDIRVGKIVLIDHPIKDLLTQCKVEVSVRDGGKGMLLPARITIVNQDGILQPVSGDPGAGIVVRPGCIYTGSGKASFGLPGGVYTIYANHGFEYGVRLGKAGGEAGHHQQEKTR